MPDVVIDKLYLGRSGQPPFRQIPGTIKSSVNVRFDIAWGFETRNATRLQADLIALVQGEDYYWFIHNGNLVGVGDGDVVAFKLSDGSALTVTVDVDVPTDAGSGDIDYLTTGTFGVGNLQAAILNDEIILLNRQMTPARMLASNNTDTVTSTVNLFSDLPAPDAPGESGNTYKVSSSENLDPLGHYKSDGTVWSRVPDPADAKAQWDPDTMPLRIFEVVGGYDVRRNLWAERMNGSEDTNPAPKWDGRELRSVFFHDGRLFLLGSDHLASSRAGQRLNLWVDDITNDGDGDPIQHDLTHAALGKANWGQTVGRSIFIDCEKGQLDFGAGERKLTRTNGTDAIIGGAASLGLRPGVSATEAVVFDQYGLVHRFQYSGRLFGINNRGMLNQHASDEFDNLTPKTMHKVRGSTFIVVDDGSVHTHEQAELMGENGQVEMVQSAWGKLTFMGDIEFIGEWGGELYAVTRDATGYSLVVYRHAHPVAPAGYLIDPTLDRREALTGTYDAATGRTKFTHTGRNADLATSRLMVNGGSVRTHRVVVPVVVNLKDVEFDGDFSGATHFLGFVYADPWQVDLTDLWAGASKKRPVMSELSVLHQDTTDYLMEWQLEGSQQVYRKQFEAARTSVTKADSSPLHTGVFSFLCMGDARRINIKIKGGTPGRASISALEYVVSVERN